MPITPKIVALSTSSVDILNAIRNNASQNYKSYIPKVTEEAELKAIGNIIMDNTGLQNEFLSSLVNRIGKVMVTSKMYQNPWKMFKKGILEFGETIEEIFVELAKPFQYDPEVAESNMYKRQKPDVRTAFHILNYEKFYKVTVEEWRLRKAFLSFDGMSNLIVYIIDSMYNAAEYDELQVMKYMLARQILRGRLTPITISAVAQANMNSIVTKIKGLSNAWEFMSNEYNIAGVRTFCNKPEQYLIVDSEFDASMDVNVLASAFNMSKAEFMGHRVLIDSFGKIDNDRLAELFEHDTSYVELTTTELTALSSIPAVMLSKEFMMIFDNLIQTREKDNAEGLYWNYWYHTWKTFSVSPFANNAVFIPATPAITSVTISPETVSLGVGEKVNFTATVVATNFAPQTVEWSINSQKSTIDQSGNLVVGENEVAETITVTVKSTYDTTKTDTATVTIVTPTPAEG